MVSLLDRDLADRKRTAETDLSAVIDLSYGAALERDLAKRLRTAPACALLDAGDGADIRLFGEADPAWCC